MNRRPNAPKCILGVAMVVLLVIGGWATTTARLSTAKNNILTATRLTASAAGSPLQSSCGPTIPPALCNTFEIEGNAVDDSGFPGLPEDWNDVYSTTETNAVPPQGVLTGAPTTGSAALVRTFINDQGGADQIFTQGGSKDFNDISDWRHTTGSVPDKDQITHGGAARYHDPTTGHDVLTFFADRFDNSGDSNIGFWFFKNPIGLNPDGTFSSLHAIGDIFIISSFTKGGGTSTIQVFKWVGANAATECAPPGVIDPKSDSTAFPNGTLCNITAVASGGTSAGSGIVNGAAITVNWPYTQKGGAACNSGPCSIPQKGLFFEGGIDLTALGLGDECFSAFMLETRSSAEVSAVLKDFALGNFQQCELTCTKSANPTTVCAGGSTTYTYSVTNPGAIPLSVTVTDDNGTPAVSADDFSPFNSSGGCADSPPGTSFTLAAGATATCTRVVNNVQSTVTNSIHVVGSSSSGTQLTCDSSVTVTVNPSPVCSISGPNSLCAGATNLVYSSTGSDIATHSWSFANNTSGASFVGATNGSSVTVNAGGAGSFTLRDDVTSSAGCTSFCTFPVTVNPNPVCNITGPASACAGSTNLVYSSSGSNIATHSWSFANNTSGASFVGSTTGASVTVNVGDNTGGFTLRDDVQSAAGCLSFCTIPVTVTPNPVVAISTADVCADSITLTATVTTGTGTAPFHYVWTRNGQPFADHQNVNSFTDSISITDPGTYCVTVTDASGNNCSGSTCRKVGLCLQAPAAGAAQATPKVKTKRRE